MIAVVRASSNGWTPARAGWALVLTALGVLVTFPAWADMFRIAWIDEESSHVLLVPLVVGWLAWVRRSRLRYLQFRGSLLGPFLVAVGWAISSFGFWRSVQSFWHFGAVLVAVGCIVSVLGRDLLMRFLPVFVVLIFLVPIPGRFRQRVAVPMMTATAAVTQSVSEVLGMPAEREGNQLTINGMPVTIAEACNGLRMVFTLVLVSYAFAFGEPLHNYVRFLILIASPLSAIVCNVVRLVPTIWLYGHARREVASLFHDLAGWVMLGVAFLLLMGIIRVLRWALIPVGHYTLASE